MVREAPEPVGVDAGARPWLLVLALVAAGYSATLLALTVHVGLGYDEAVYISQFAHGVPAAGFSAARAEGMPLLVAPVAAFTVSVTAIRVYLSLLAGAGLLLAYWPWLRLRNSGVVPLAAFLFASTWLSLFYGGEAMPNLYVSFGAVSAVGLFALAISRESRASLLGLGASFAFLSLVRPTDSLWIAAPLVLALLLVPGWRRLAPFVAIAAGLAVGWGEWIVEAFVRFGGLTARLHDASTASGIGGGVHITIGDQLRVLDGPLLCRAGADCGPYPVTAMIWLLAILALAAVGLYGLRRAPFRPGLVLAVSAAAAIAASYVFFIGYAVPRYLMPVYALLALPAAEGLGWLAARRPGSIDPARAALVAAGVAALVVVQARLLDPILDQAKAQRGAYVPVARAVQRQLGIRPPCLIWATQGTEIAYAARCDAGTLGDLDSRAPPPDLLAARAAGKRVVLVAQRPRLPWSRLRRWDRVRLRGIDAGSGRWYAYAPPGQPVAGRYRRRLDA